MYNLTVSFLVCSNDDTVTNLYVGDDGKLHLVKGGVDTVIPFSSYDEGYNAGYSVGYSDGNKPGNLLSGVSYNNYGGTVRLTFSKTPNYFVFMNYSIDNKLLIWTPSTGFVANVGFNYFQNIQKSNSQITFTSYMNNHNYPIPYYYY